MAEEAQVVNEQVEAVPTPAEATPAENQSTEVVDEQAKADQAVADSLTSETDDDGNTPDDKTEEAQVDETQEEEKPQNQGAEDRKQQLSGEIRDLVSQRNAIRQEVERLNAETYQPATETELQEQGLSPEMAAIEAMKQERELERYNTQVSESQLTLRSEAQNALKDFPMFDPSNKDSYNPAIAEKVDKILGANLQYDQNTGQVVGSNVSVYELYQSFAETAQSSTEAGKIAGQKATEKMLASADSPTGAAPAKSDDNFLKGLIGDR